MEDNINHKSKYSKRYTAEGLEKLIIDLLEKNSRGLNINQISNQLEINRNTLSKWLKTLEAKNKIISRKIGVSNLYYKAESKDKIFPGPYVLTIEFSEAKSKSNNNEGDEKPEYKFRIKQSNNVYISRLYELRENLIEADLFKFYPFSDYKVELTNLLVEGFTFLHSNPDKSFSKKITFNASDDKTESFLFEIKPFSDKKNYFIVQFDDLTLIKFAEQQLLNSETIFKILNLFNDSFVSVQSQDYKVVVANKKALDELNDGRALSPEPIYCDDLYRNNNASNIGKSAMETNKDQFTTFKISNETYHVTAIPIDASETDMKGFILVLKK